MLAAAGLIVAAGAAAYSNSFAGKFLFDDENAIVHNPNVRRLWPPRAGAMRHRPVLFLSLAANYAFGGLDVRGYHAVNLAAHLLAALALFGVVRRTLLLPRLGGRFASAALPLAAAAAAIWAVHPLQTGAVTYVVQRAESMMGMFFLLTMYFAVRGFTGGGRAGWFASAAAACAAGMGTKEVMVAAPVVVLLYDRVFVAASWREVAGRRWVLYAVLAGTWLIVAAPVAALLSGAGSTGVGPRARPWGAYALTQSAVIAHYLRLAFWPVGLCLDYGWTLAKGAADVFPQGLLVAALLAGTAVALWRRPAAGFLGAWFFLILAPTSSIIPLADAAFEHRMYLPLAAVVCLVVIGGYALAARLPGRPAAAAAGTLLAGAAVAALAALTYLRNEDYADAEAMYRDVVGQRPENQRARANLGFAVFEKGRIAEAGGHFQIATDRAPDYHLGHVGLARVAAALGRADAAIGHFQRALQLKPNAADVHNNLGMLLRARGRVPEAIAHYRRAIEIKPYQAEIHNNLGVALAGEGNRAEAVRCFREAIRCRGGFAGAHKNLGAVLLQLGQGREALRHLQRARALEPDMPGVHYHLGLALVMLARPGEAVGHFRAELAARAGNVEAANALAWVLATCPDETVRDGAEAVTLAEKACGNAPGSPGRVDTLAAAYAEAGRFEDALVAIDKAIGLARKLARPDLAAKYAARRKLYEAGRPFRSRPPGP